MEPSAILQFWFEELNPKQWFQKNAQVDQMIATRFSETLARAKNCELFSWRATPPGRLAEILVLDQFSRNIFRDLPDAFAADPLALALAQEAIHAGEDLRLEVRERVFLYLPFMHSESRVIHETAIELFKVPGMESNLNFELLHKAIIDRFGRFPHRNEILGRPSTPEEIEFLKQPGSRF